MDLLTKMVEHHNSLIGEMLDRVRQLPLEEVDRPIELSIDDDFQTLRSLLSRLIGQMGMWNCANANRPYDWSVERGERIDAMREHLARVAPVFLAEVRDMSETGRLDETFVDAQREPRRGLHLWRDDRHVLTFAAHNRTLVVLALKKAGVGDLCWGVPMKWVTEPP